ncbi:MAG: hypothetical protein HQ547_00365 [Candidatus Omnitrophica bacterium]|nr:hypothetical protein [Candidatus Omnitrophota bacterium]
MKITDWLLGFIIVWVLGTACFAGEVKQSALPQLPQTDVRVSMDFRDANVKDVLKVLSKQSGINFIPSEDIQDKKVTLYLEDVPVKNAINSIVEANRLTYEQGPDTNIFIVRPSGEVRIRTITKIYTLNFTQVSPLSVQPIPKTEVGTRADSLSSRSYGSEKMPTSDVGRTPGIVDILSKLLTPAGNIVVDQRTNSLIISDIPENFELIEEMVIKLDTPTPQVFIEAEIVETSLGVTDKLGLDFGGSDGSWSATYSGPSKSYSFPYDNKSFKAHGSSTSFTFGTLSFGDLSVTLKALRSDADTKYLARPKILTLNNETAIIDITSDTYVGSLITATPDTQSNTTSAERITTGVSLKVTPQVNAAGFVTMLLEPSVSRTEASSVNSNFLNPITRSAKAKVMVKDGETIFIGGLLDNQTTGTKRKVPILGDIPLIGALFRSDTTTDTQTEILIFITPHIVRSQVTPESRVLSEEEVSQENSRNELIEEMVKQLEEGKQ